MCTGFRLHSSRLCAPPFSFNGEISVRELRLDERGLIPGRRKDCSCRRHTAACSLPAGGAEQPEREGEHLPALLLTLMHRPRA